LKLLVEEEKERNWRGRRVERCHQNRLGAVLVQDMGPVWLYRPPSMQSFKENLKNPKGCLITPLQLTSISEGLSTDSLMDAGYPGASDLGGEVCGMAAVRITSKDFLFWFGHTLRMKSSGVVRKMTLMTRMMEERCTPGHRSRLFWRW